MKKILWSISVFLCFSIYLNDLVAEEKGIIESITPVFWEQAENKMQFAVFTEKEEFDSIDKTATFVIFIQTGKRGDNTGGFTAEFSIKKDSTEIYASETSLDKGMSSIVIDLSKLYFGKYFITAKLIHNNEEVAGVSSVTFFRYVKTSLPERKGRVAIVFPEGLPEECGRIPISTGIPFPRGVLYSKDSVRLVDSKGEELSCQTVVRSRWGSSEQSSIRWLGIDFQAQSKKAYWPERNAKEIVLEYGENIKGKTADDGIKITEDENSFNVDNGKISFVIRKDRFNLIDSVKCGKKEIFKNNEKSGLYLVDHEGTVYRAANDKNVKIKIEEKGRLRSVLRIEGWYVKEGTSGEVLNWTLPTGKLCKFIVRIETYKDLPVVRILNTWIITYDSFSVKLKDMGIDFALQNPQSVQFATQDKGIYKNKINAGSYLIQHLHNKYSIEQSDGKILSHGNKSSGWVAVEDEKCSIGISNRNTWQRFPKEFEVTSSAVKLHVWPAHGRRHDEIDPYKRNEIHKLWFAHQGKELNLQAPWEYFLKTVEYTNSDTLGVYTASAHAMAAVQASAMGISVTSDFLISFADKISDIEKYSEAFQEEYHALPEPEYLCASGAVGMVHHYDPDKYYRIEEIAEKVIHGYWGAQNDSKEYGMWIYRVWNNGHYYGDGVWNLYRLYNGSHHYDAYMPWLYYARTADPFYLEYGLANIRQLADVQVIHYEDRAYPHQEFYARQKRLVGSMKHDNGFVPWGADHMVGGHGTCFNGLILAYYLTGDLRLREVVVDEWQKTLLTRRLDPQYRVADRSKQLGRDSNNALGEMIDLYQLTYEPAILGHLEGLSNRLPQHFWFWGHALHNELAFRKTENIKNILTEGVESYIASGFDLKKAKEPVKSFWYTHAPEANPSYIAAITGRKDFAEAALALLNIGAKMKWAETVSQFIANGYCHVPDNTLSLPSLLYALEKTEVGSKFLSCKYIKGYPSGTTGKNYAVIHEDEDQIIDISINGTIKNDNFKIMVYNPAGKLIIDEKVKAGAHYPKTFILDKDNMTGDYVVFNSSKQGKIHDTIYAPLTCLKEVYYSNLWTNPYRGKMFFKSYDNQKYSIKPHVSSGEIYSVDMKERIAVSRKGEAMEVTAGTDGAWILSKAMYIKCKPSVLLSVAPERWFAPKPETIKFIVQLDKSE